MKKTVRALAKVNGTHVVAAAVVVVFETVTVTHEIGFLQCEH